MELDFLDTFLENIQRSFFMNIRPVEASCSMRAVGQTDGRTAMTKIIVAFRNFVNSPKNEKIIKSNSRLRAALHKCDKPYIA